MFRSVYPFMAAGLAAMAVVPANAIDMPDEAAIDAIVEKAMAERRIPGLAIAIMHDGHIVFTRGYGFADLEHRVPVHPDTVFQSGSVGKMFTATAVMLLERDGKLSLDDRVTAFFPGAPESWNGITIRHLLSHRSGLADYEEALLGDDALRLDFSNEELLDRVQAAPLDFAPGTDYAYSNTGYVLLGLLIEKVSGQFYGDLLAERVFRPLGMRTARVNDIDAIVPNRARGYLLEDGELQRDYWVSPTFSVTADGSLLFTVLDLSRWDAALYTDALLPQAELARMWRAGGFPDGSRPMVEYGFGWQSRVIRGHRLVEHGGVWQGFSTQLSRYLDDGLTIAILTNLERGRPGTIAERIAGLFDEALRPYEPIEDREPTVTDRLRGILAGYLDGRLAENAFIGTALEEADAEQQRRIEDVGPLGESTPFELVYREEGERGITYRYRVTRAEGEQPRNYSVRFEIRHDGKIISMSIEA